MNLALDIKNLTKTYQNGTKALKNLNLEIQSGEFFALLGENGAGKTTTIGILTDLVKKTEGTVKVFGEDIDNNFTEIKKMIGVVPQEMNFGIFERVIDIVVNQAGYYGINKKIATQRAEEILTKLGLEEKMYVKSMQLSGGMKRRLMIARALVHSPKFLILDEPTAGVDVTLRLGMWDYLKEINQKGVTILLTTHYLEEVEQLCDRAGIMHKGELVKIDSVRNLTNSLDSEKYLIDFEEMSEESSNLIISELDGFQPTLLDKNTIQFIVSKNNSLDTLTRKLINYPIKFASIKPNGSRLEEMFVNLISK
jgi:ABC-2 type transport system ATP-binding protein